MEMASYCVMQKLLSAEVLLAAVTEWRPGVVSSGVYGSSLICDPYFNFFEYLNC